MSVPAAEDLIVEEDLDSSRGKQAVFGSHSLRIPPGCCQSSQLVQYQTLSGGFLWELNDI